MFLTVSFAFFFLVLAATYKSFSTHPMINRNAVYSTNCLFRQFFYCIHCKRCIGNRGKSTKSAVESTTVHLAIDKDAPEIKRSRTTSTNVDGENANTNNGNGNRNRKGNEKEKAKEEENGNKNRSGIRSGNGNEITDVNSVIVERMKRIIEEKITTQLTSISSLRNSNDPHIRSMLTESDFGDPNRESQIKASMYIKSEPLLSRNKHAKDIFQSEPWTGEESSHDANLRMILDSTPKQKPILNDPVASLRHKKRITPQARLSNARDVSLDYKLNKKLDSDLEESRFREMYKERLLGPSMLLNSSASSAIDYVGAVASNKINASINQQTGKFDDEPRMQDVRGKPLSSEHLKNCTDLNYFMNQILNKQEVLPPWIEAQQNLDKSVSSFRANLDQLWFKWIVNDSIMSNVVNKLNTSLDEILNVYEKDIKKITFADNKLPDVDLKYIKKKVESLNNEVRHYNLQCPSLSGHKLKLDAEKEIKASYWRTLEQFPTSIEQWLEVNKGRNKKRSDSVKNDGWISTSKNMLGLFRESAPDIHENKEIDTNLHIWQAIKDIFKPDTKKKS